MTHSVVALKLSEANALKELEALLKGSRNRYRDCREYLKKNDQMYTHLISTNFSKLFRLIDRSNEAYDIK